MESSSSDFEILRPGFFRSILGSGLILWVKWFHFLIIYHGILYVVYGILPVNIVHNVLFFGLGGETGGGGAGGGGGGQGRGREGGEGRGGEGGEGGANDCQGIRLMGGRAHVHIDDVVCVVQPESER